MSQFPQGNTTRTRRHLYTQWVVLKERNPELKNFNFFLSPLKRGTLFFKAICYTNILEKNSPMFIRHEEMLENQEDLCPNTRMTICLSLLGTALSNTYCPSLIINSISFTLTSVSVWTRNHMVTTLKILKKFLSGQSTDDLNT